MKFNELMRETVKTYLDSINANYDQEMKLSTLLEIVRSRNESNPDKAVGVLLMWAIKEYEREGN